MSSQGTDTTNSVHGTPNGDPPQRPMPKPSPFKRGLNFNERSAKKGKVAQKLFIIHVQPQVNDGDATAGVHGFLVGSKQYCERLMIAPLYNRTLPENENFLNTIQPMGRVFSLINPNGTPMMKGDYQCKAIGILIPQDMVATMDQAAITAFVNDTIGPSIALLPGYTATDPPTVDEGPDGYTVFHTWNKCINDEDIRSMINIELRGEDYGSAGEYMRASIEHLYSLYGIGEISNATRLRYELTAIHMDHVDAVNLGLIQVLHPLVAQANAGQNEENVAGDNDPNA